MPEKSRLQPNPFCNSLPYSDRQVLSIPATVPKSTIKGAEDAEPEKAKATIKIKFHFV